MYEHKKRVYVAGPLTASTQDYIINLHRMIRTAGDIMKLGCAVYVPGWDFLQCVVTGNLSYDDVFNNSWAWLDVSDVIFMCKGWSFSAGCKREHLRALELGKPICYSIEDLKAWLENES